MRFICTNSHNDVIEIEARTPFHAARKVLGHSARHESGSVDIDCATYHNDQNEFCILKKVLIPD